MAAVDEHNIVARTIAGLRAGDDTGAIEAYNYTWGLGGAIVGARHLTGSEMDALADAVAASARTTDLVIMLDVYHPDPAQMARFLGKLLANHPSVTEILICGDVRIPGNQQVETIMPTITNAMKLNTSLTALDLQRIPMTSTEAKELFEALADNTTLEDLGLANLMLLRTGTTSFISEVSTFENISLKSLAIHDDHLGDDAAKIIFRGLWRNRSLESLDLQNCGITDESCEAIAELLRRNTYLHHLELSGNSISDVGAAALESSLKHDNASLWLLSISPLEERNSPIMGRLKRLCRENCRIHEIVRQIKDGYFDIKLLGVWPSVLEIIQTKPTLLLEVLKLKPGLFGELSRRKRRRLDRLRY